MPKIEPVRDKSATISADIDAFLAEMTKSSAPQTGSGRLIFALDATASRRETWDMACQLQGDMFRSVAAIGGLNVQLVYYRDLSECRSSRWVMDPDHLAKLMTRIECRAGKTQIGKVLAHAQRETGVLKVSALVFVGDAFEEDEDKLLPDAHELGRLGVPIFMFQEGNNRTVERVFREIARLSKGAYCRFDEGSAKQLGELLKARRGLCRGWRRCAGGEQGCRRDQAAWSVEVAPIAPQLRNVVDLTYWNCSRLGPFRTGFVLLLMRTWGNGHFLHVT